MKYRSASFALALTSTLLVLTTVADASTGPAWLLKDINTQPTQQSGSSPYGFMALGSMTIFVASTAATARRFGRPTGRRRAPSW